MNLLRNGEYLAKCSFEVTRCRNSGIPAKSGTVPDLPDFRRNSGIPAAGASASARYAKKRQIPAAGARIWQNSGTSSLIKTWISKNPVTTEGYPEATKFLKDMEDSTDYGGDIPPLIQYYDARYTTLFDKLFENRVQLLRHPPRGFDYTSADFINAVQDVYKVFAQRLPSAIISKLRGVRAQIQLYARSELVGDEETDEEFVTPLRPVFLPTASLPAAGWMQGTLEKWESGELTPTASAILDVLVDRHSLIWTVGTAGTWDSFNRERWSERAPSLHQLVLAQAASKQGDLSFRLHQAIKMLANPWNLDTHSHLIATINTTKVLRLLGDELFWKASIEDYIQGWDNAQENQAQTLNGVIGWLILHEKFTSKVVDVVMRQD
ncbi:hypothetical protein RhiLY_12087 [Ceratobasidium sp. AG-Ba]|nr:hypothetical protein RhiLY_12087 [Ceratobasidium sp. AG-Ba]